MPEKWPYLETMSKRKFIIVYYWLNNIMHYWRMLKLVVQYNKHINLIILAWMFNNLHFSIYWCHALRNIQSCKIKLINTYISRTLFNCSSLHVCWHSTNVSLTVGSSLAKSSKSWTMFSTSCNCFGFLSFNFPSFVPPYLLKRSKNLQNEQKNYTKICGALDYM